MGGGGRGEVVSGLEGDDRTEFRLFVKNNGIELVNNVELWVRTKPQHRRTSRVHFSLYYAALDDTGCVLIPRDPSPGRHLQSVPWAVDRALLISLVVAAEESDAERVRRPRGPTLPRRAYLFIFHRQKRLFVHSLHWQAHVIIERAKRGVCFDSSVRHLICV